MFGEIGQKRGFSVAMVSRNANIYLVKTPRPYPTTDLKPSDAFRALRKAGFHNIERAQVERPATWATLVAVWESKRNAENRLAYNVDAWAQLARNLGRAASCSVATRCENTATARLHRMYQHIGVAESAQRVEARGKTTAAKLAAARAVEAIIQSAQRDGERVTFEAAPLLGNLVADSAARFVILGTEDERVAFERTRMLRVASALRPMTNVRAWLETTIGRVRLCLRWTNRTGRTGGLDLRADIEQEHELRGLAAIAVVFPRGLPSVVPAVLVAPPAPVVEAPPVVAPAPVVRLEPKAAPSVKPAAAIDTPAAPAQSRTAQAWVEFKATRPAIERLVADLVAGRVHSPEAAAYLTAAKSVKPTSWGSTLRLWRLALAAVARKAA